MTETKFTPGPWEVDAIVETWIKADHLHVATVPTAFDGDFSPANAALIAAAPELYEAARRGLKALSTAVECAGGDPETHICCVEMRAALAKARGES